MGCSPGRSLRTALCNHGEFSTNGTARPGLARRAFVDPVLGVFVFMADDKPAGSLDLPLPIVLALRRGAVALRLDYWQDEPMDEADVLVALEPDLADREQLDRLAE